jgi:tRNA (guanine37-N1)-methyltransferase
MLFSILTIFPKMYDSFLATSIIKRAIAKKKIEVELIDFRKYSTLKKQKVDDYQYGGGSGMVISHVPIVKAINAIKKRKSRVIYLSPQGSVLKQQTCQRLAKYQHIILICGHYEGIDSRIENYIDEEISIGDYILTGGEVASMVIVDCVSRLIAGTINKKSLESESFTNNLLDYPVYTKPLIYEKHTVPEILLSGNHQKINQ